MHPRLTALERVDDLDRLLAESKDHPVLLFKHSYSCGISAEALDELVAHLGSPRDGIRYAIVIVQTHRDVSNAVASRLSIRHETPQALLIRDGQVAWSASHFRVNSGSIEKALRDKLDTISL